MIDILRKYNEANNISPDEIADVLINLANVSDETKDDLIEAIYQLQAIAQNKYNNDYYRTFYNVLIMLTENNEV